MRLQNNGAQQLASEATIFIVLEDVNDEIPLFTEREQERVLEGEEIGTVVTRVNAIDSDAQALIGNNFELHDDGRIYGEHGWWQERRSGRCRSHFGKVSRDFQ